MARAASAIPEGHHTVTPYLCVKGGAKAIDFYKQAFCAKEMFRMGADGDRVGHAELEIGDSRIMLADEHPEMGFRGPHSIGGSPVHIHLYVEDCDRIAEQAVKAGAKLVRPVKDQFYGDRTGTVEDPFGHVWHVATHKEDLSSEEIAKRMAAACAGAKK
jgi:PhnB protein